MKILRIYINFINQLNEGVGKAVSWLTLMLVLLICFDVLRRYLFKTTSVAFIELEWYIFSMIFILGAGYSLKHDQHVRVDVFYNRMSEKGKAWIDLLGGIIFLIPFCVVIIYVSWKFTTYSFRLNEGSSNPNGLSATYLIKGIIPLGFTLLCLQATAFVGEKFLVLMGKPLNASKKGEDSHA